MPTRLRDILSARVWVGLDIREDFLGAVQLRNRGRGPEIEKIASTSVREGEDLRQVLVAFFSEHDLRPEGIVTSLPASAAVFREIPLPVASRKMLDSVIAYQLEPHIPQPVEDMVVGYTDFSPQEPVLAFGVPKERLVGHLEVVSGAGLHTEGVTLDDLAFHALFQTTPDGSEEPVAILHVHEHGRIFQVVRRHRLDFIRILPRGPDHAEGLVDTLRLYDLRRPGQPPSQILLTGGGLTGEAPEAAVAGATGIRASLWRPFEGVRHSLGRMDDDLQLRLSVALALAVCASRRPLKSINLLKGEFRPKSPEGMRRHISFAFTAAFLLAALLSADTYVRLHKQEAHHASLRSEMTRTLRRTFPDMAHVVKGQELVQMRQKLADETARQPWLHSVTSRGSLLDLLLILTETISAHPRALLEGLSVEGKRVILEGSIGSFQVLDTLKTRLAEAGVFETVKLGSAKLDKESKVVKYHIILEMK
ncbi:MAG: hypothetical protein JXL84_24545 [Deltaproteobacteria bacterium]|nr:hypothetical protein [Deltaproteobacteria bacterium]